MDEAVLFYLSEGGDTRITILQLIHEADEAGEGMYLNKLAEELDMSHVGVRNHLKLLLENGYVEHRNPNGKPKYVKLTDAGKEVLKELDEEEA